MKISKGILGTAGILAGILLTATVEGGGRFGGGGGGGGARGGGGGGARTAGGGGARTAGGGGARNPGGGGNVGGGQHNVSGSNVASNRGQSSPMTRPATTNQRPATANRGSVDGPFGGSYAGGPATRPGQGGAGERHVYQTPGGATIAAGGKERSYTGPGGNTVSGGRAGDVVIGPNGNVHAGGVKGGSVTTAGGASAAAGSRGSVTAGPGGAVVSGGRAGTATGRGGTTISGGSRGTAAVGPGGAAASGGRAGAITGPGGTTVAGGSHGAAAVGPYGAAAGRTGAGGAVAAGGAAYAGTRYMGTGALQNQGANVRRNFGYYNAFSPGWYNRYPGAWAAAGWAAGAAWRAPIWNNCASYVGYPDDTPATYYNYGDNVTYQDGNVYMGDQVAATEADYAQQATNIADTGRQAQPPASEQWQPLGVFAMVKGDETTSNDIFQLAISKDGVVRGNYYNAVSDNTTPLYGSLEKKSQRIAWTIGDKKEPVYETGLYNLTQPQTTMLVHFSNDHTEQYNLFQVPQQEEDKK